MKGIFVADAAAGAEVHYLNGAGLPHCTYTELDLPDLVESLIPEGTWYWRETSGLRRVLTTDSTAHCQYGLLQQYCDTTD